MHFAWRLRTPDNRAARFDMPVAKAGNLQLPAAVTTT